MTDHPEQPAPKRKRRRASPPAHTAVEPASLGQGVQVDAAIAAQPKRRAPRKRGASKQAAAGSEPQTQATAPAIDASQIEPAVDSDRMPMVESTENEGRAAADAMANTEGLAEAHAAVESAPLSSMASANVDETSPPPSIAAASPGADASSEHRSAPASSHQAVDEASFGSNADEPPPPEQHAHPWIYAALALFLLSLAFGAWGVWKVWSGPDTSRPAEDAGALRKHNEQLSQEVSTLRRSDQISRDANRDLQRTLAERDEEIAGLRADVAFYERFVGATGQRHGLSVHDLEMKSQNGDAWRFVATLTQNLNRGAINAGRLTLSVEGSRNDRLERLSWSNLRQQNNPPGAAYSFRYFQQVEGDVMLPKDFKPVRVTVRLVPEDGAAIEQSFPWADTLGHKATAE